MLQGVNTGLRASADRIEALEEQLRVLTTDAWYREGEEVCTMPTRNLIRARVVLAEGKPEP